MPINPIYNDIEMGTAWAEDAATTIPSVPVPGIAYRNTGLSEETVGTGQQYDSIGRSADWNELLYKISANIITLQRGGATLLWISGRQYEQGALVKDPNNAQIYYRKKAGAGTTRPSSDSTNWQLLQDLFCGEGLLVNSNNEITWGLPNTDSTNPNTLIQSGVYWLNNQKTNTPTDIENSNGSFTGFIVALRRGLTTQQIAYEVNGFSMNTRRTSNNGSSWSAWQRFGVNFTLDWNSGHDYRVGDLVRDTSNSLLYVCTTAISNSTQRPGLDTGHFTLLQAYLIGDGLRIINSKIEWGYSASTTAQDFNEMKTNGIYAVARSTENAPSTQPGYLIVLRNNSSDNVSIIAQLFLANNGELWKRIYAGSSENWGSWTRYSLFDSLDFVSGQTYNQGQLVRGSNNVHYVKKTAASVCTTEPNSDSTNFESLAENLVQSGISVFNGKLTWGYKNYNNISDCNAAVTPGMYFVTGTRVNVPVNESGMLIVITNNQYGPSWVSSAHLKQLYIIDHNIYVRSSTSIGDVSGADIDPDTVNWNDWGLVGPTEVPEGNIFATGDFVATYRSAREGFLLCNGTAVSRTTYAALFSVIGTKFGDGDGSTTFNLPDFRGRVIQGANSNLGTSIAAGLPNITGSIQIYGVDLSANKGAFLINSEAGGYRGGDWNGNANGNVGFNASSSNSIYGKSTTVQPPAIALNILIKY